MKDHNIFTLTNVNIIFNQIATEYEVKTKISKDMFLKIDSILEENKISREILNKMKIFFVTDEHISYQIDAGKFKVVIDLRYGNGAKLPPYLTFTIKNITSKRIVQLQFFVYENRTTLSAPFILLFRNAFTDYYE